MTVTVTKTDEMRVPLKSWAVDPEAGALEQATNLTKLPFAIHHVALMPDAHQGYGMPIGGVLFADHAVVPYAVGVDIGCFTGDTKVVLPEEKLSVSIAELAERTAPFLVYSVSPTGRIVAAEATAKLTRQSVALVLVTLDDGSAIRCTPDHLFMRRDGGYAPAESLARGTSLMPLYRKLDSDGYVCVQQPYSGRWQRAHWLLVRSGVLGPVPSFQPDRTVIHHKDFDEANNDRANLQFMSNTGHSSFHRSIFDRNTHWQSPEFESRRKAALSAKAATPEGHAYFAERGTPNIVGYMTEHREEFLAAVAGNGRRGAEHLIRYNQSERGRQKSREVASREYPCGLCPAFAVGGFGIHRHRREVHATNHRVISVEPLLEREDVFCLNVPTTGNFALQAGVFVHNCGVSLIEVDTVRQALDEKEMAGLLHSISRSVPVGNGPQAEHGEDRGETFLPPDGTTIDNRMVGVLLRAQRQLGTLGGGNHFLELQYEDVQRYEDQPLSRGARLPEDFGFCRRTRSPCG